MTHPSLLIELFTEELPPKALKSLGESFAHGLANGLRKRGLVGETNRVKAYASPRRLAVLIEDVLPRAADQARREKLLPVSIGLADGRPTAPLIKKLASLGLVLGETLQPEQLIREGSGKAETLMVDTVVPGVDLTEGAQAALEETLAALPIPKLMRYQRQHDGALHEVKFVRPAHGLVALHGSSCLPLEALGLKAQTSTQGHRFLSPGAVAIPAAEQYESVLRDQAKVVASFADRRAQIVAGLQAAAQGRQVVMPDALLDEVCALVEWPVVLEGHFDQAFLSVPQECLILTMQQNQKYFALTDAQGQLMNAFLLVSNLQASDPSRIIAGNERVLRARLADAKFFFDQDRRQPLASRLAALEPVVYHNKIGSQRARIERLRQIAAQIAGPLQAPADLVDRSALLCKADLVTDMVGEFPELQGLIGQRYAQHDQEAPEVALAMAEHYQPRFSGDALPESPVSLAVALADRLETLVGIWGIGLIPTGEKDPFALRRAALGVVRMLVERRLPLPLNHLLEQALASFQGVSAVAPDLAALQTFVLDRARGYLRDLGHSVDAIEAVFGVEPNRLDQALPRLEAVRRFLARPEALDLCAANKRIGNILKKAEAQAPRQPEPGLYALDAERSLGNALGQLEPESVRLSAAGDYESALSALAGIKASVDQFFDQVMVNDQDPQVRQNRLALLGSAHRTMNQVADLSRLAA